jgi:hypothetical protein
MRHRMGRNTTRQVGDPVMTDAVTADSQQSIAIARPKPERNSMARFFLSVSADLDTYTPDRSFQRVTCRSLSDSCAHPPSCANVSLSAVGARQRLSLQLRRHDKPQSASRAWTLAFAVSVSFQRTVKRTHFGERPPFSSSPRGSFFQMNHAKRSLTAKPAEALTSWR